MVILIGLAISISIIGGNSAPLVTILAIAEVIVALALRGIAENFAAEIVLQTRGSIKVGDETSTLGHTGSVEELNGRSVVIRTVDGRILHLPNGKLIGEPFANHTTLGGRRSKLSVECNSADRAKTIEAIARAVATTEGVLPGPAHR